MNRFEITMIPAVIVGMILYVAVPTFSLPEYCLSLVFVWVILRLMEKH